MITTNYENTNGYELIPEGDYEVIIASAAPAVTAGGTSYINVKMIIRNDVENKFKNRYLFYPVWKIHNPSEQDYQVEGYSFRSLMMLAKAVKIPAGKEYKNVEELCKDFVGKCVRAGVVHDEFKGKTQIKFDYLEITNHPECKHIFKGKQNSENFKKEKNDVFSQPDTKINPDDFEDITPGDLPF